MPILKAASNTLNEVNVKVACLSNRATLILRYRLLPFFAIFARLTKRYGRMVAALPRSSVRRSSAGKEDWHSALSGPASWVNLMSYNMTLLFEEISARLGRSPCGSLGELSQELRVGRRTVEKAVKMATRNNFREFRRQLLLTRVSHLLASQATLTIKELSFAMGYRSARSFARAIRRACGLCPEELRSHETEDVLARYAGRDALEFGNDQRRLPGTAGNIQ